MFATLRHIRTPYLANSSAWRTGHSLIGCRVTSGCHVRYMNSLPDSGPSSGHGTDPYVMYRVCSLRFLFFFPFF